MTMHLLRALFVLVMFAIGYQLAPAFAPIAITLAVIVLAVDILSSRRKLLALSGMLVGMLVGLILAGALGYVAEWIVDAFFRNRAEQLTPFLKGILNVVCCYLAISFILQTKDDIRFIIPYVEFAKQTKGVRPLLVDTSALVDGRMVDLAEIGLIDCRVLVPRFVLDELHAIADSSDRLRRNRGRRGLDVLAKLQANRKVDVSIFEGAPHLESDQTVDHKLVTLAAEMEARVLTTDFNLNKVAHLRGVDVINLNELAQALKPVVLPGERLAVQLIKAGEQHGQGVGYLDDGTMVVIEQARQFIGGGEVEAQVTSVVQTSAGRMIFGRLAEHAMPRERSVQPPAKAS
jgi:uncharacterized protein YacL